MKILVVMLYYTPLPLNEIWPKWAFCVLNNKTKSNQMDWVLYVFSSLALAVNLSSVLPPQNLYCSDK
jgi:hypothetical protein